MKVDAFRSRGGPEEALLPSPVLKGVRGCAQQGAWDRDAGVLALTGETGGRQLKVFQPCLLGGERRDDDRMRSWAEQGSVR